MLYLIFLILRTIPKRVYFPLLNISKKTDASHLHLLSQVPPNTANIPKQSRDNSRPRTGMRLFGLSVG